MKRTWLATAALAVTALLASACGSAAGTPQVESSSAPQTQSSSNPPAESTADVADAGATDDSADETSTEPSAPSASTTVMVSGDLDAQSAAWFSTVCTGMAPMIEQVFALMGSAMGAAMGTGTDSDPAATQQQLASTLDSMSTTLSDAAKSIAAMPPPTMANGKELAAKIVEALGTAAPKMKQAAQQLSATKVSTSEQLQQAMGSIESLMDTSMDGLSLDEYQLDPKIEEAMKGLPACAPLYSLEDSATATN